SDRAARIRSAHDIPPQARVVMNIRRLMPHWGAMTVQRVALSLLARRSDLHVVLLEGASDPTGMDAWLKQIESRGWRDRVSVVRGHSPLQQVADLMAVSDIGLSLVDSLEPCSLSVLQAAAAGGQLVIADQETYRALCRDGLHATLVAPGDDVGLIDGVLARLDDAVAAADVASANRSFIGRRFDHRQAMLRLLRIVAGETAYRPSDRQDWSGWLSAQATKPGSEIAY
ncbi:MAG: glycosyltransferase, partial [Vicinamibacterales bacterium]